MKKYVAILMVAVVTAQFNGCRKSEDRSASLNKLISGSPVIFLCEPEGSAFVIRKIYRLEQSWGSDIRIGESLVIQADPQVMRKPFLILRGAQKYISNGLGQSQIPVNADGRLEYFGIPLEEVERRVLKDTENIRSTAAEKQL
jgi:hypothetical protein